jgi:arylsulfatase A-like enzyme
MRPGHVALPALAGLAAVLAVAGGAWLALRAPAGPGPSTTPAAPVRAAVPVIVYLVDTLRADRLGAWGYGQPTSPNIDALAREGVVFEHAYGPAPWTLPSLASILTSTYACEHGITRYRRRLAPAVSTLAERLGEAGYESASYYGNGHAGDVAALNRGFDVAAERNSTDNDRSADVAAFLDARGPGRPWLLYLHTMETHEWFSVPPRYFPPGTHVGIDERETLRAVWFKYNALRSADWAAGRPVGTTDNTKLQRDILDFLDGKRTTANALYDAAVRHADDNVGRVVARLKANGAWDEAVFVLLADHGEELGEHGGWFHDQAVYEELVHVPLLVHLPGGEFGGRRVAGAVSLVDVVPTILDAIGRQDLCAGCRGTSLLRLAAGDGAPRPPGADYVPSLRTNEIMYFRPFRERRGDLNVVLRRDGWKGIWNADVGRLELYDLAADPGEQDDASGREPALAAGLQAAATGWLAACRDAAVPPAETGELDDRTRARLRAMGYLP